MLRRALVIGTMDTIALKLVLTPALIAAASLAGRRWGQTVSGWFVGLPLTSGPVALILALDHGAAFAAEAATGSLAGATAEVAYCLAYGRSAAGWGWPPALAAGCAAVAANRPTLPGPALPPVALAALACAGLVATLRVMPRPADASVAAPPTRWDLPARMLSATTLVVLITQAAPALGPRLSGVLATFPVYAAILTVFAH